MNVGLFFGSFNPIHVGHLIIANVVREQTGLEQVWFVISPQNPFKQVGELLNEHDRLQMVTLATESNRDLQACDVEFGLPRPSYTADTLKHLDEQYPQHDFHLILGSDNLSHLHRWKDYRAIIDQYLLHVYPRSEASLLPVSEEVANHTNLRRVEAPLLDISATLVRDFVQQGRSIRYLVTDPVAAYIQNKKLYL